MSNNKYGENERRIEFIKSISTYLEEVGLLEFSFRGAAKVAGVSPMTLVRYFKNRDGLLDALLEYSVGEYIAHAETNWPGKITTNLVESMRKLISDLESGMYDIESKKLWFQLILLAESPNAPNAMKKRYLNLYSVSRDYIIKLLQLQGLSKDRAINIGSALHSFSNGVYRDYYTHKNKEITRSSFDLLLNWLELEMNEDS